MPTALDRLLHSPSALRVLRAIVHASDFSASCIPVANSSAAGVPHRAFSSTPPRCKLKIRRVGAPNFAKVLRADRKWLQDARWLRIDEVQEPEKASLWVEALLTSERRHGLDGIREVYHAMVRRRYKLPTNDTAEAGILWGTLLKHPQLVLSIIEDATQIRNQTGKLYSRLYEKCMVHWLPRHPDLAQECHHHFVVKLRLRKLPLRDLVRSIGFHLTSRSLEAFLRIYETSNERNMYDEIVPALCDQRKITEARQWHMMCFKCKDFPSNRTKSHPMVQLFTAEMHIWPSRNTGDMIAQDQGTIPKHIHPRQATGHGPKSKYNEELRRRLTARETAPVRFDDPFCARLFYTTAFSPASVISGLVMVGVNEIGPQALRAMALRTKRLDDLNDRFRELKEAGIALKGCVYSLALEKFVTERNELLVRSILDSDQHPDVYDDVEMQKRLLDFYLQQSDWAQAHRTLAILSMFHNDISAEAWNVLLQARIRMFHTLETTLVLQGMRTSSVTVTQKSHEAIRSLLRGRVRGRRPAWSPHGRFDDLRFVTRLYIFILEAGIGSVYPFAWREIFRRYGLLGRFRELRRLLFWALCWYAPRRDAAFGQLPRLETTSNDPPTSSRHQIDSSKPSHVESGRWSQRDLSHPIRQLFPPSFQQGIIIWGFQAGLLPNAPLEQSLLSEIPSKRHYRRRFVAQGVLQRLHWSVGLQTLVKLRELGVHVHRHAVIKALQMQFIVLFGRGRSSKRSNRIMEAVNRIPYDYYVTEVNRIWGEPLFRESRLWGKDKLHRRMWHPWLKRVVKRQRHLKFEEATGVALQSRYDENEMGDGDHPLPQSSIPQKDTETGLSHGSSTDGRRRSDLERVPGTGSRGLRKRSSQARAVERSSKEADENSSSATAELERASLAEAEKHKLR
ncbi:hypothetical protein K491DRAFT_608737 [Lophiostoma macrostomum CBS 122681]|uniref:Uncharacterized protein n=1 Tax=Lophiostoma macrostomum CBS 122681 TaxID=1314788 RepID=A0A6A6STT4_9PLEO|nr:hypothetical protein K491DRAFT_608737 [Lophiostoma macrostomum CBS 122681]